MLPNEEEQSALCRQQHAELFRTCNRWLGLGVRFIRGLEKVQKSSVVVLLLFVKATKTFRSVLLMCERGLCENAQVLLRVLTEILIDLKYILRENIGRRSRGLVISSRLGQEENFKRIRGNPKFKEYISEEAYQLVLAAAREDRRVLGVPEGTKWGKVKKALYERYDWRAEVAKRAANAEASEWYDLIYSPTSRSVHNSDLTSYLEVPASNKPMLLRLSASDEGVREVLEMACLVYREAYDCVVRNPRINLRSGVRLRVPFRSRD